MIRQPLIFRVPKGSGFSGCLGEGRVGLRKGWWVKDLELWKAGALAEI